MKAINGRSNLLSYLITNRACECAALVMNNHLTEIQANELINEVQSLNVRLDWILLTERPDDPVVIELIQNKCGGVVAGNAAALSKLELQSSDSVGQFEQLSEHQIILLGHIELQVLPAENKSCFQVEDNLFIGSNNQIDASHNFKKQIFRI